MLSYIHAYHAGNHADILKHITFSLVLDHLTKKEKPFCIIDTHAASGFYHINDERILKTEESKNGIEKLITALEKTEKNYPSLSSSRYIQIAASYLKNGLYPGSPEIARIFLRQSDHLILNELHPQTVKELKANIKNPPLIQNNENKSPQISVHQRDAWEFILSAVPPKIKRGCVIIDPSYEDEDDFQKTAQNVVSAYKKWRTGIFLVWYPLLPHKKAEIQFLKNTLIEAAGSFSPKEKNWADFSIEVKSEEALTGLAKLYGSGMFVINPPFGLEEKINCILPELKKLL